MKHKGLKRKVGWLFVLVVFVGVLAVWLVTRKITKVDNKLNTNENVAITPTIANNMKLYKSGNLGISFILPREFKINEGVGVIDATDQADEEKDKKDLTFQLKKDKTQIDISVGKNLSPETNQQNGIYLVAKKIKDNIKYGNMDVLQKNGTKIEIMKPVDIDGYSGFMYKVINNTQQSLMVVLVNDRGAVIIQSEFGNTKDVFGEKFMGFFNDFLKTLTIE